MVTFSRATYGHSNMTKDVLIWVSFVCVVMEKDMSNILQHSTSLITTNLWVHISTNVYFCLHVWISHQLMDRPFSIFLLNINMMILKYFPTSLIPFCTKMSHLFYKGNKREQCTSRVSPLFISSKICMITLVVQY